MQNKACVRITLLILVVFMMPISNASSSGINFLDATISDHSDAHTNSVSVNQNQTIIASSYGKYIEFHNASSLEIIKKLNFGREVYDIDFSPNGKYLAASISANEAVPDSIRIVDVENLEVLSAQARGNNRPGNLDYSPDGAKIIAPNMNNGAQILNSVTMDEIATLNGIHTSDVTCAKFSATGNYVLTGDENGKVQLWDAEGEPSSVQINVNEEIVGCDFSNLDAKFAISTITGNIYSYSLTGAPLQYIDLANNYEIEWSDDEDILYILESESNPAIITLDGSTFETIHITSLMHKSLDFTIIEANGMIEQLFVATDTNHIAIYGKPVYPEGYGMMGSDFDGDNIPDLIDKDDDGDSFDDDYDFNCLNSTVCSRDPDLETIRSIVIQISGDTLMLEDVYTMSQSDTYLFRNLTRRGIISDQRIEYQETNMLENAFCNNMDQNDYIQKLQNTVELSVGQVANGTLQCNIIAGLSFTKTYDKEQIKFALTTTFDVQPNVTLPLTVTLNAQISVIESSITHKMENHPILLQQINSNSQILSSLWWNDESSAQPVLNFTSINEKESNINLLIDLMSENYLQIVLTSIIIIISTWFLVRRRNLNSVILNQDEFEDEIEITDIGDKTESYDADAEYRITEQYSDYETINETNSHADDYQEDTFAIGTIQADEKPMDRRAFTLDDETSNNEKTVKRRRGRIQRNAQGPIMSTKRKRLDGKLDIPGQQIVSKKVVSAKIKSRKVANTVKVRKVRSVKKDD